MIRAEFAVAILAVVLVPLWYITTPATMGGGMFREPPPLTWLLPLIGIAGVITGFAWMVRLSRPDPEAGERTWRYRDF